MDKKLAIVCLALLFLPSVIGLGIGYNNEPVLIRPGRTATIFLYLINKQDHMVMGAITATGPFGEYLVMPRAPIPIQAGEIKRMPITIRFPEQASNSGEVTIKASEIQEHQTGQITAKTHSIIKITFLSKVRYDDWAARYLNKREQHVDVTQLPPQPERIKSGIEIGDFFVFGANTFRRSKLPYLLGALVMLVLIIDLIVYFKRKKKRAETARRILYGKK